MNTYMQKKGVAIMGTRARGGIRAVIENHIQAGVYEGYRHYFIASHDEVSAAGRIALALGALFKLIYLIISKRISMCHLHGSMKASVYRKALFVSVCRIFGCKAIFHLHGSEFAKTYDNAGSIYRFLVHYVLDNADSVFVLSRYWKDYIDSISTNRNVRVINNFPSPVYEKLFEKRDFSNHGVTELLFLGYIGKRKGIYDLVEAVELLHNNGISRFRITVGGNGEIDTLKALIARKGLEKYFNVVGWVSGDEKFELLKRSQLLLLPSHNEGLPIAILEALSAGVAVLSTTVGGIPDAIKDDRFGLLVEPGEPDALAKAMRQFLQNHELIESVARNARERYNLNYSADANRKLIRRVFDGLACA